MSTGESNGHDQENYESFRNKVKEANAPFLERLGMIIDRKANQAGKFLNDLFDDSGRDILPNVSLDKKILVFGIATTATIAIVATGLPLFALGVITSTATTIAGGGILLDTLKRLPIFNEQQSNE